MKKLCIFFMAITAILLTSIANAAIDPPPVAMLKNITAATTTELDRNLGNLKGNDRLVSGIVKRHVVPYFDLPTMSQLIVGKTYWQAANPATQQQFIKEFTNYVIKTYSSAIESYDGEQFKFYPIRGFTAGQNRAQVNSDIIHKDGPPIHLQYRLSGSGNSWKIYDFSVDGVSIVQNYRAQFASTLRQGGLNKLVVEIQKKNK